MAAIKVGAPGYDLPCELSKAPWARLCTGRCQSGLRHYGTALPRHVATYRIEVVIRPRLEVRPGKFDGS